MAETSFQCLTVDETAERLGLCSRTICNLIKRGDLPAARVGRRLVIPASDLEAFVRARMVAPADAKPEVAR